MEGCSSQGRGAGQQAAETDSAPWSDAPPCLLPDREMEAELSKPGQFYPRSPEAASAWGAPACGCPSRG